MTSVTERVNIVTRETFGAPCSGDILTYGSFDSGVTSSSKTATVSRPKPADPTAFASLTPFTASESKSEYGIVTQRSKNSCVSGGKTYSYFDERSLVINNTPVLPFPYQLTLPEPNVWLDIRQQMEETEWNVGGYIGEYDETIALFVNAAKTLRNAWLITRGRLPKKVIKHKFTTKDISAARLNSEFAIKPLVSDVHTGLSMLNEKINSGVITKRFISTKTDTYNYKSSGTVVSNTQAPGFYNCYVTADAQLARTVRAIVYADHLIEGTTVDFGNPIEWAWEGIPFSFVADWMFGIGDYLAALNATNGYSNIRGVKLVREIYTQRMHYSRGKNTATNVDYIEQRPWSYFSKSINRTVLPRGSIPLPNLPKWQPTQSFNALLNASALLHLLRK